MTKKEYKVGETFQLGFFKLRAEKPQKGVNPCRICFISELTSDCRVFKQVIGECSFKKREDKTDVIFVNTEESDIVNLSIKGLRKAYDDFYQCLKKMNDSSKKNQIGLTDICEKYRKACDYAKKNSKGDFCLSTRLENAYMKGWDDCKKFYGTNKEE